MVRIGDQVVAIKSSGNVVCAVGSRTPVLGQKCVVMPDGSGGYIAVKPLNNYPGDDGICTPLPCGAAVSLVGEPPNYLPASWESGFGMSCSQGIPQTTGWTCSGSCPINPSTHPTPGETCRRAYGLSLYWRDSGACTHSFGSGSWRANAYFHHDVNLVYYGCSKHCYQEFEQYGGGTYKRYCPYYETETVVGIYMQGGGQTGTQWPAGCFNHPARKYLRTVPKAVDENGQMVDPFYSYACNGPRTVCPLFRGGAGTPFAVCGIKGSGDKGPSFSPGPKPVGCKNQGFLNFDGWSVPGGEQNANTNCVLGKATEGTRSQSDDTIRCKFMSPSGTVGELSGAGDVVNPISPANTNAFGQAGSQLSVNANISIGGRVDMDYTRIPARQSKNGNACVFTIGRY